MSHDSLENFYRTNFKLVYSKNYSLSELDGMLPWEREIYIELLLAQLEHEEEERKKDK